MAIAKLIILVIQLILLIAFIFSMGMAIYYQIKADRLFKKARKIQDQIEESARLRRVEQDIACQHLVYPESNWKIGGE